MKDRIHSIGNKREKYPRVSAWRAFTVHRVGGQDAVKLEMCVSVDLQCTHGGVCVGCRQLMWQASVYRGSAFAAHRGIDAVRRYGVPCARFPDSSPWSFQAHISRGTRKPTAAYICIYTQQPTSSYSLFLYMLTQKVWMKHTPARRVLISLSIEIKTEQLFILISVEFSRRLLKIHPVHRTGYSSLLLCPAVVWVLFIILSLTRKALKCSLLVEFQCICRHCGKQSLCLQPSRNDKGKRGLLRTSLNVFPAVVATVKDHAGMWTCFLGSELAGVQVEPKWERRVEEWPRGISRCWLGLGA